jgi:glycoprotein-N-acetylgalactosamine 3-beta-galactosyltransferase
MINYKKRKTILIVVALLILFSLLLNYYLIDTIKDDDTIVAIKPLSVNRSKKGDPRIFCLILTQPKNLAVKARNLFDSWAQLCNEHLFLSVIKENVTSSIELKTDFGMKILQPAGLSIESYRFLTKKMYLTIKDVYKRYNISDFDWFLKVDDDTFIFYDNLRSFLSDKRPSEPITYGYRLRNRNGIFYFSGGAGYVLSREAFHRIGAKLNENFEFCSDTGIEDVDVSICLNRLNVSLGPTTDANNRERFHPLSLIHHYRGMFPKWFINVICIIYIFFFFFFFT